MTGSATYTDGELAVDGVPLSRIAAAVGTPCYVYSTATMEGAYRSYENAFRGQDVGIRYAIKANTTLAVIRIFSDLGAGADVVSAGELARALAAGVPANRIVFSGVGKTPEEMRAAMEAGIEQINVESEPELEVLSAVAAGMGVTAPVAVRVNPDVDARTHAKITTGKSENKFGIDLGRASAVFARAAGLPGIRAEGIAVHIGSQLLDLAPYEAAYAKVAQLIAQLRSDGRTIDHLDLGGGLGISYDGGPSPDHRGYADVVRRTVGNLGCRMLLEPGRSLVGNAGSLLSRVLYVKHGASRRFVIIDAAMNDLLRPALYDAFHGIRPVREDAVGGETPADVVGPVCETGDTFARQRPLPDLASGDLLVLDDAGAYGAVMAFTYNGRPLPAEVLCRDGEFAVIARRPSVAEMMARETLPPWLAGDIVPARRQVVE